MMDDEMVKNIVTNTVGGLLVIVISSMLNGELKVIITEAILILIIISINIWLYHRRCKNCTKRIKIAPSTLVGDGGTENILSQCDDSFYFMGVSGNKWIRKASNFNETMKRIYGRHGDVRFILLNPNSEEAKRLSILRGDDENLIKKVIIGNIRELIPYQAKGLNIRVKVYSHRPVFRIAIVDKDKKIFVGSYNPNDESIDIPQIILDNDKNNEQIETLLRKQFIDYYQVEWENNSLYEIDLKRMNDEEYIESIPTTLIDADYR